MPLIHLCPWVLDFKALSLDLFFMARASEATNQQGGVPQKELEDAIPMVKMLDAIGGTMNLGEFAMKNDDEDEDEVFNSSLGKFDEIEKEQDGENDDGQRPRNEGQTPSP